MNSRFTVRNKIDLMTRGRAGVGDWRLRYLRRATHTPGAVFTEECWGEAGSKSAGSTERSRRRSRLRSTTMSPAMLLLLAGALTSAVVAEDSSSRAFGLETSKQPSSHKVEELNKKSKGEEEEFLEKLRFGLESAQHREKPSPPAALQPISVSPEEVEARIDLSNEKEDLNEIPFKAAVNPLVLDGLVKKSNRMLVEEAERRSRFKKKMMELMRPGAPTAEQKEEKEDDRSGNSGNGKMEVKDEKAQSGVESALQAMHRIGHIMSFLRLIASPTNLHPSSLVQSFALGDPSPIVEAPGKRKLVVIKGSDVSTGDSQETPERQVHFVPKDIVRFNFTFIPIRRRIVFLSRPKPEGSSTNGNNSKDDEHGHDSSHQLESYDIAPRPNILRMIILRRVPKKEDPPAAESTSRPKREIASAAALNTQAKEIPENANLEDANLEKTSSPESRIHGSKMESRKSAEPSKRMMMPGMPLAAPAVAPMMAPAIMPAIAAAPKLTGVSLHFQPYLLSKFAAQELMLSHLLKLNRMKHLWKMMPFLLRGNPLMYEKLAYQMKMFPKMVMGGGMMTAAAPAVEHGILAMDNLATAQAATKTTMDAAHIAKNHAAAAGMMAAAPAAMALAAGPVRCRTCAVHHALGKRSVDARPRRSVRSGAEAQAQNDAQADALADARADAPADAQTDAMAEILRIFGVQAPVAGVRDLEQKSGLGEGGEYSVDSRGGEMFTPISSERNRFWISKLSPKDYFPIRDEESHPRSYQESPLTMLTKHAYSSQSPTEEKLTQSQEAGNLDLRALFAPSSSEVKDMTARERFLEAVLAEKRKRKKVPRGFLSFVAGEGPRMAEESPAARRKGRLDAFPWLVDGSPDAVLAAAAAAEESAEDAGAPAPAVGSLSGRRGRRSDDAADAESKPAAERGASRRRRLFFDRAARGAKKAHEGQRRSKTAFRSQEDAPLRLSVMQPVVLPFLDSSMHGDSHAGHFHRRDMGNDFPLSPYEFPN